jgi:hypothetical protein
MFHQGPPQVLIYPLILSFSKMQSKESSFKMSQFECRTTVSPMPSLLSAELFAERKSKSRIHIVSGTGVSRR